MLDVTPCAQTLRRKSPALESVDTLRASAAPSSGRIAPESNGIPVIELMAQMDGCWPNVDVAVTSAKQRVNRSLGDQ